jgi:hypothetical protein
LLVLRCWLVQIADSREFKDMLGKASGLQCQAD